VIRFADGDTATLAFLEAELGVRILSSVDHYQAGPSEDFLGAVVFDVRNSDIRIELALWPHAAIALDTWLARRAVAHGNAFAQACVDPRLRFVEITEPSSAVIDFARRVCATWAEVALGEPLGSATWLPEPRAATGLRIRSLALDAKLSQLMAEPIGALTVVP
jgi:hypothetical protein